MLMQEIQLKRRFGSRDTGLASVSVESNTQGQGRWIEEAGNVRREFTFGGPAQNVLCVKTLRDERPFAQRVVDSFLNRFFPLGYPHSVAEGYLVYSQFRALQHFSSAVLSVFSTQSLLFAAGLRPSPAQATVVSWVLKDGMQHVGKLVCSSWGARMDSEPKRWRIFADCLYDLGAGLEVIAPLCPQWFLEVAGIANLAKGMATVAARATRLSIYSAFAKEKNLSDLYAKGEAISTLYNVLGLGVGIHLASTICSSMEAKLLAAPLLSVIHIFSVTQEMRAAPVNTLNAQRTGMLIADFIESGSISSAAELRYRERLILPVGLNHKAGSVQVGVPLQKAIGRPSVFSQLKNRFSNERFILNLNDDHTDLVLHDFATGEDAIRGWLLAAYAAKLARNQERVGLSSSKLGFGLQKENVLDEAYKQMEKVFPTFITGLKERGWHTDLFLEGSGVRVIW
eukprot:c26660_g1_i1 orf=127-1488(+)